VEANDEVQTWLMEDRLSAISALLKAAQVSLASREAGVYERKGRDRHVGGPGISPTSEISESPQKQQLHQTQNTARFPLAFRFALDEIRPSTPSLQHSDRFEHRER
jgi:hypothetical protein